MKKQFISCLLAVAALLLPTALSAQPASYNGHVVYTWAPYPNVPDTSIVRQWNDDYVISKVHHGIKKHFNTLYTGDFLSNIPGSTVILSGYYSEFPDTLDVRDFRVLNDKIFFCGTWMDTAVYGWLPIDISYPPINKAVYNIHKTTVARSLDRMIVYIDNQGRVHMVALSENTGATGSILVEVADMLNGTSLQYASFSGISPLDRQYIDDMALLGDYVILAERDRRSGYGGCAVRVADKNDVVGDLNLADCFQFPYFSNETFSALKCVSLGDDQFMLAAKYVDASSNYGLHLYRMRYDALSGTFVNTGSQTIPLSTGDELEEMIYMATNDELALLFPETHASYILIARATFSGSYNAQRLDVGYGKQIYSIDNMGQGAFAAWGRLRLFLQKGGSAVAAGKTCMYTSTMPVTGYTIFPITPVSDPPVRLKKASIQTMIKKNRNTITANQDCFISY